jgi:type VI secretion system secreted protein Hcp
MKRKIMVVGLVLAVAACVAAAAAYAISGGELPGNRTSGHVVADSIQGGDSPGTLNIAVESWSWGVSNTATGGGGGGGGGAGRADFNDLTITKTVDKASPVLMLKCASGQHLPEVTLTVDRPGGGSQPFLEIKLTDALISSVSPSGSANDLPMEQVSFNYDRIQMKYSPRDGSTPVQTSWNLSENRP